MNLHKLHRMIDRLKTLLQTNNINKVKVTKLTEPSDFTFTLLKKKNRKFIPNSIMKIYRGVIDGQRYWEKLKPYEIIDNNLCVRFDPWHDCYIALSEKELRDILTKIENGGNHETN